MSLKTPELYSDAHSDKQACHHCLKKKKKKERKKGEQEKKKHRDTSENSEIVFRRLGTISVQAYMSFIPINFVSLPKKKKAC